MGRLLAQQQGADWAKRRLKAGVAYARRRQLDQAIQLYDSALQLRPDYADALIARGAAYANKVSWCSVQWRVVTLKTEEALSWKLLIGMKCTVTLPNS